MVRSRALSLLVTAIIVLAAGAVPARAQDLDFVAVPKLTLGLTNQGPVGTLCATGLVNFGRSTGPGTVTGTVTSASEVLCGGAPFEPSTFTTGSLTLFTGNKSVVGTLGGETLVGQLLPFGHGLIAIDTFGESGNALIDGVGLTVLIERGGVPLRPSDDSSSRHRSAASDARSKHHAGRSASAASIARSVPCDHQPGSSLRAPACGSYAPSGSYPVCAK